MGGNTQRGVRSLHMRLIRACCACRLRCGNPSRTNSRRLHAPSPFTTHKALWSKVRTCTCLLLAPPASCWVSVRAAISAGPVALRHLLVDHSHAARIRSVRRVERSTTCHVDVHHVVVTGKHDSRLNNANVGIQPVVLEQCRKGLTSGETVARERG